MRAQSSLPLEPRPFFGLPGHVDRQNPVVGSVTVVKLWRSGWCQ